MRILALGALFLIPAAQVLLALTGEYRRHGLLLGAFPYLEHHPRVSDAAYAVLFAIPTAWALAGNPFEAFYFLPLYVVHQIVWATRRLKLRRP